MADLDCKCNGTDDEGCETVEKKGFKMKLYKGFVSRSTVTGLDEPLYVQTARYDVPGKKDPSSKSMAELELPDGRKISLKVDDEPRVWVDDPDRPGMRIKRGPIRKIVVHLGDQSGEPVVEPAEFADRVRVKQGKKHVLRVVVHPYAEGETTGGVMAASETGNGDSGSGGGSATPPPENGGGGTWEINNAAVTCPWTCD